MGLSARQNQVEPALRKWLSLSDCRPEPRATRGPLRAGEAWVNHGESPKFGVWGMMLLLLFSVVREENMGTLMNMAKFQMTASS